MSETRSIPPLRIAVLGDFDGMHTRRWVEVFVQRGHEVHAISYYRPRKAMPGVTLHLLSNVKEVPLSEACPEPSRRAGEGVAGEVWPTPTPEGVGYGRHEAHPFRGGWRFQRLVPPSLLRLVHAGRYLRAGLKRVLDEIQPDVFHAHYAVEHGFYGSFAGYHPYVVSAWGSDLLAESHKTLGRWIARRALHSADLVTCNDASLAARAAELGVPPERLAVVHLGIERLFLDAGAGSVNLRPEAGGPPTVVSDRALEPLYNVDSVIDAFARLRQRLPTARLLIANDGSQRQRLEALARKLALSDCVSFLGQLDAAKLAEVLASAHVYASVPSSDSLALSTLEAMAAGCFPVVSDLPSAGGWITHGVDGLRVPPRDPAALADALYSALGDAKLRRSALEPNRARVEADGLRERNMLLMERHYYRLAGHPMGRSGEGI